MVKYKVIDNFLDKDDFENLSSINFGNISKNEIKTMQIIQKLHQNTSKIRPGHPRARVCPTHTFRKF